MAQSAALSVPNIVTTHNRLDNLRSLAHFFFALLIPFAPSLPSYKPTYRCTEAISLSPFTIMHVAASVPVAVVNMAHIADAFEALSILRVF